MTKLRADSKPFRPRARLLLLLGDQLIREPGIAVFELVKNAYDADSPSAKVTMSQIADMEQGQIIVEDSGTGMDYNTVMNVWLEPGTDFRAQQRDAGERTLRYGRLPLGEKGVGRFAAHKLGNQVKLITRRQGQPEVVVEIDWRAFLKHKYLDDVPIGVRERRPQVFKGKKTGTRIEVSHLRYPWNRGMVRELSRSVTSICSPFDEEGDFSAELVLTDDQDWLKGLLTVDKVLDYALFRAACDIIGQKLTYKYEFIPFPAMDKVESRKVEYAGKNAMSIITSGGIGKDDIALIQQYIGPIHLDLYIFDRDPKTLELGVADRQGLGRFLDRNGGIRVYRDGIRVYDYGEPGNDWLELGGRRVNIPVKRISNNLVIGAVSLELDKSAGSSSERDLGLIEKTNREGFVDNAVFQAFRQAVFFAITQIEKERNEDKLRIRNAYTSKRLKEPVLEDLTTLRDIVEEKGLEEELGSYLDRIESDFRLIRDRFLVSASAGLSLSVVIHEVEKGIEELARAVEVDEASPRVKELAQHLANLIEGYAELLRKSGASQQKASDLIKRALFNTDLRLRVHKINVVTSLKQSDFKAKCSRRLIIATLMNLIDNSIWWLDNKWGEETTDKKRIYIGTSMEFEAGPAIIVADNGPGFIDPPEYLIEPFISRKPDGMGLGLHIADQVMKVQGGRLEFPEPGELSLPEGFDGAVVALVFGGTKK